MGLFKKKKREKHIKPYEVIKWPYVMMRDSKQIAEVLSKERFIEIYKYTHNEDGTPNGKKYYLPIDIVRKMEDIYYGKFLGFNLFNEDDTNAEI